MEVVCQRVAPASLRGDVLGQANRSLDQPVIAITLLALRNKTQAKKATVRRGDYYQLPGKISSHYVFRCHFHVCFPVSLGRTIAFPNHAVVEEEDYRDAMPMEGHANDTWVEVLRYSADPPNMGFFMFHAPGSGIWFHLGRTIAFPNHAVALRRLCPQGCGNHSHGAPESRLAGRALELGYDSVQFTRFVEFSILKLEILFTWVNTPGSEYRTEQCGMYKAHFDPFMGCAGWKLKRICGNEPVQLTYNQSTRPWPRP